MRLFWARIKDFFRRLIKFLTRDIWVLDFSELSNARKRLFRSIQAFLLTAKGFASERVGREAVALSQFTMMAFIPMIAVILFISHGFGLDRLLSDTLMKSFPTSTQLIHVIMDYALNIVKATESGVFGWISFLSFVWTIVWLMINVELAFNRIWEVKEPRKLWQRAAIYFAIMFITPFVLLLLFSGWAWYARFIGLLEGHLGLFSFITTNMFWLAFYGIVVLALSVMYKFIPHAKVRYGSALKAALIVGVGFVAIQYLYMGTQLMVTRLGAVYGALAFIPLFLIWLNLCWQVILFGAELTRGYTLVDFREAEERGLNDPKHDFYVYRRRQ
ncbi:MAG: YihY/virulence factor BrkB family protein [Bacteroidales bacterium]|nr:YihY/virulence factor BrkB family protein [Bacteroidales bacterium]